MVDRQTCGRAAAGGRRRSSFPFICPRFFRPKDRAMRLPPNASTPDRRRSSERRLVRIGYLSLALSLVACAAFQWNVILDGVAVVAVDNDGDGDDPAVDSPSSRDDGGDANAARNDPRRSEANPPSAFDRREEEATIDDDGDPPPPSRRDVDFLTYGPDIVSVNDLFSATWIQPVSAFLDVPVHKIHTVEDGCFKSFVGRKGRVKMTVDWLDFSVEHLSKWWKTVVVPHRGRTAEFDATVAKLKRYAEEQNRPTADIVAEGGSSPLNRTVAMIAFQPYASRADDPGPGRELTASSLAATIASLRRAGLGRVVVVGYDESDAEHCREAFRMLTGGGGKTDGDEKNPSIVGTIGGMEVNFVRHTNARSKFIQINMPRAAVDGMQRALGWDNLTAQDRSPWIGDHDRSHWKYVCLTEPDTILQTRRSALGPLRDALDDGFVLAPHRLQPIPHEVDFRRVVDDATAGGGRGGGRRRPPVVTSTGPFVDPVELDAEAGDACCDDGNGRPGLPPNFDKCKSWWWSCGFAASDETDVAKRHERLVPYGLMRLRRGTGVVSLAGTVHGRRCVPRKNGVCEKPKASQP